MKKKSIPLHMEAPDEILVYCLSFLSIKDLARVAGVNQNSKRLAYDQKLPLGMLKEKLEKFEEIKDRQERDNLIIENIKSGNPENIMLIKALLAKGLIDANYRIEKYVLREEQINYQVPLLCLAVRFSSLEITKLLLEHNAFIKATVYDLRASTCFSCYDMARNNEKRWYYRLLTFPSFFGRCKPAKPLTVEEAIEKKKDEDIKLLLEDYKKKQQEDPGIVIKVKKLNEASRCMMAVSMFKNEVASVEDIEELIHDGLIKVDFLSEQLLLELRDFVPEEQIKELITYFSQVPVSTSTPMLDESSEDEEDFDNEKSTKPSFS